MPGPPIEKLRDCVSVSASARASLHEKGEEFCFKEILSLFAARGVPSACGWEFAESLSESLLNDSFAKTSGLQRDQKMGHSQDRKSF